MKSMTGFAYGEAQGSTFQVSMEIKGLNNKFLDINLYVPVVLASKDEVIKDKIRSQVLRGRVDVTIRLKETAGASSLVFDSALFSQGLVIMGEAKRLAKDPSPIGIETVLAFPGVLRQEQTLGTEELWDSLEPLFTKVLGEFLGQREREGLATKDDLVRLLGRINASRTFIESKASGLEKQFKETIIKRFHETLGDTIDENRVLQEVAVMLTRYSIHEELARLAFHLRAAEDLVNTGVGIAKRLEFLGQELHREVNTIGSKSADSEVSEKVIDMKEAIDAIREQIRNIE